MKRDVCDNVMASPARGWHAAGAEEVRLLGIQTQPGWVSLGQPHKSRTWPWACRRSSIGSVSKEGLQIGRMASVETHVSWIS